VKGSGLTPLDSPWNGLRCYVKLLWLNTSEAHTQSSQAYKDEQYERCKAIQANRYNMAIWIMLNTSKYDMMIWMMLCTNKWERVERYWIKRKDKICFEVRAPSSTSPPTPPCRISNPLSPTEGTSTKEDLLQQWSTELLSQTTTSQPRGRPVANTTTNTSTEEVYNLQAPPLTRGSKQQPNTITSTEEGSKPIPLRSTSTKEGYNKIRRVYNLEAQQPQTLSFSLFHKNKILNRLG